MPSTVDTPRQLRPDVDLTDGAFYAGDSRPVYRWMRENEPVFRDRNGLAAAATYQAVIDAERAPELFSNAGGIRPDQDAPPMMIAMDDPLTCCGANSSTRASPGNASRTGSPRSAPCAMP